MNCKKNQKIVREMQDKGILDSTIFIRRPFAYEANNFYKMEILSHLSRFYSTTNPIVQT